MGNLTRHFSKVNGKVHEKYLVSPRKLRNHHLPIRMVVTKKIKACTSGDRKRNAKNTPARSVDNAATVGKNHKEEAPQKSKLRTTTGASRSHPRH